VQPCALPQGLVAHPDARTAISMKRSGSASSAADPACGVISCGLDVAVCFAIPYGSARQRAEEPAESQSRPSAQRPALRLPAARPPARNAAPPAVVRLATSSQSPTWRWRRHRRAGIRQRRGVYGVGAGVTLAFQRAQRGRMRAPSIRLATVARHLLRASAGKCKKSFVNTPTPTSTCRSWSCTTSRVVAKVAWWPRTCSRRANIRPKLGRLDGRGGGGAPC